MPTAVMPAQHPLWQSLRFAQLEDAFDIAGIGNLVILAEGFVSKHFGEEPSRWKLFTVADNNDLLRPRDRAKCVFGSDLARLIHDQQIELQRPWRKELGDRYWTHHEYWFDRLQSVPRLLQEFANRQMSFLFRDLPVDHRHLAEVCIARDSHEMRQGNLLPRQPDPLPIE